MSRLTGLLTLPPLSIPAPAGRVSIRLQVPRLPAFLGRTLHTQCPVLHRTPSTSWRFTNLNADRILR